MSSRIRKFESGNDKLKRKKKIEKLIKSQQGALDKFVVKELQASLESENINKTLVDNETINEQNLNCSDDEHFVDNHSDSDDNNRKDANEDSDSTHPLGSRTSIENLNDDDDNDNESLSFHIDSFYPRCWDALDSKMIDVLAVKGPKRDKSIQKGPKSKFGRRFVSGYVKGRLVNEGYADWTHIAVRLQEHEVGLDNWATCSKQLKKKKDHWKNVLLRIVCIVKFLAKYSLAFRGTKERLYENNNGNFLGLIEMLAEFDLIIQEHQSTFSVILDCTPDISHQEQMSLILRAFYTPCNAHSLNLMLCDMENTCSKARHFFGVIQRIYTIFAHSTKRWQILKDNVKDLTLKSMSSTRWESRIDSVRAIRFQLAIANDHLEKVAYEDLIEDFVSKNSRRLLLLK
uniref:Uncharacterized protein n=1 Tax=Kalanchoe fedtschenkoi TaxID=63787 RepID=A0A7N0VHP2_KALFE